MRKRKDKEKQYQILIIILTLMIIIMTLINVFNKIKSQNKIQEPIYNGLSWNENQTSADSSNNQKYIAVPGITDLYFVSNSVEQTVNFYNPKDNLCLMDIQIATKDNGIIWQIKGLKPNDSIQNITISNKFDSGIYPAYVIVGFKTIDNETKLNGSTFKINIIVGGKER